MGHFGCQRQSPAKSLAVEAPNSRNVPNPTGTAEPLLGLIAASMGPVCSCSRRAGVGGSMGSSAKSPAQNFAGASDGWRSL